MVKPTRNRQLQNITKQNRTQPQPQQYIKKGNLDKRKLYENKKADLEKNALDDATIALTEAKRDLTSAATHGAELTLQTSNLKTLPPLMVNPIVNNANICISARDAYHDGSGATSIQANPLFLSVQKKMFGDNWASNCHQRFGSQPSSTDVTNGTWLNAPHNDIFWSNLTAIKTMQKYVAYDIVPRFGMKLEPYNFNACIRAVTGVNNDPDPDPDRVIFNFIVDNLNARSPSNKPPTRVSTTNRIVY